MIAIRNTIVFPHPRAHCVNALVVAAVALGAGACSSDWPPEEKAPFSGTNDATADAPGNTKEPPADPRSDAGPGDATPESIPGHVLYLNFSGAALAWGAADDAPASVSSTSEHRRDTTVPPFMVDHFVGATQLTRDGAIDAIAQRVATAFAPFNVQVVRRRPRSGKFTMVVVGGTQADVDFSAVEAGGAARVACTSINDLGLGFTFTQTFARDELLASHDLLSTTAHVIAHEAGHMFGLVHHANGIMAPLGPSLSWGSGPVTNGTTCGRSTQDDVAILVQNLGAAVTLVAPVPVTTDTEPPALQVLAPLDGERLDPAFVPCLVASDASGIAFAMVQVFRELPSPAPGVPGDWALLAQRVARAAPFSFPSLGSDVRLRDTQLLFRFVTVDRFDNLSERRVRAKLVDGAALGAACP